MLCAAPIKSLLKPPGKLALPSNDEYDDLFESMCMLLYISPFMPLNNCCCCLCSLLTRSLHPLRSLPMALRVGAFIVCRNTSDAMDDDDDDDVPLLGPIGAATGGGGG